MTGSNLGPGIDQHNNPRAKSRIQSRWYTSSLIAFGTGVSSQAPPALKTLDLTTSGDAWSGPAAGAMVRAMSFQHVDLSAARVRG